MSRSGYSEDYDDDWSLIRWRGVVASSMYGKRGQSFLKDLLEALDGMPEKKLIPDELEVETGAVCAIGALGKARGLNMKSVDPQDTATVAGLFNIAEPLVQEVVWVNDEAGAHRETPDARWKRVRNWVASQIDAAEARRQRRNARRAAALGRS